MKTQIYALFKIKLNKSFNRLWKYFKVKIEDCYFDLKKKEERKRICKVFVIVHKFANLIINKQTLSNQPIKHFICCWQRSNLHIWCLTSVPEGRIWWWERYHKQSITLLILWWNHNSQGKKWWKWKLLMQLGCKQLGQ